MGRKVISFGLSTSEINRAMKELADYKQEILRKTELLREKVAERLADEAKSGFSGAIVDELILKGGQTSPRYAQVDVSVDNRGSVIGKLAEMYNEPIMALVEEPEESEGNVSWTASW